MSDTTTPKRAVATWTRSFAAAAWLMAKGFQPTVEKAKDGSGGLVYRFVPDAYSELEAFYLAKDALNTASLEARRSGDLQ